MKEYHKVFIYFYNLNDESYIFDYCNVCEHSTIVETNKDIYSIPTPEFMKAYTENDFISFSREQVDKPIFSKDYFVIFSFYKVGLSKAVYDLLQLTEEEMKKLTKRANNFIELLNSLEEK